MAKRRPRAVRKRTSVTFDTVRSLGLGLPGAEEGTTYRTPALKVRGKMFACLASHKSAEPNTLAVRIDFDRRDELIAEDPDTYYLKDHYVNYPSVLVRLPRIRLDVLRDLLRTSWQFVNTQKPAGKRKKRAIRR